METLARKQREIYRLTAGPRTRSTIASTVFAGWLALFAPMADGSHQGHGGHEEEGRHETTGLGYPVSGATFRIYLDERMEAAEAGGPDQTQAEAVARTVIDAFTFMMRHRPDYPRFDEAVTKDALQSVIIEPRVMNREGKEFPFLVARTKDQGRVKLLISASFLKEQGYLHRPELLAPVMAREFQWVVSKADTAPKPMSVSVERDLTHAPVRRDLEIPALSGDERANALQRLFGTYLRTLDDQKSLEGQPYYDVGSTTLIPPTQPDSSVKLYDIRVREALQKIVREPSFLERAPKAVRSLLNGKIWNVSFVKIDQRDWATRTRVLPEDKAVMVGEQRQHIQPAQVLLNTYRRAAPDDPFYSETKGLPMGALSPDQLALVIALEIQFNIIEKSMTGHVAQDALTAPK